METLNNLAFFIQVDFINDSGHPVTISRKIQDNGLETNTIQVDDVLISEETINGRVFSGTFESKDYFCGYKYDYENGSGERLLNLNENVPLDTAINLINKTKSSPEFWNAKLMLSVLMRNDYKIYAIKQGSIDFSKSVSAENEKHQNCSYTEFLHLSKQSGEERFSEKGKEIAYEIDDKFISENDSNKKECEALKSEMKELVEIASLSPNDCKDLIKIKNVVQTTPTSPSI
jgi:hypothetical protein